jgi:prolyl 4-hydroxylase
MTRSLIAYPHASHRGLFCVDGFLRETQCHAIIEELDFALWRPSGVAEYDGPRVRSSFRLSETTTGRWFSTSLRRTMRAIDRRIERLVPRFVQRREEWQATRYGVGGKFDYHFDGGQWVENPSGDREHTVLLYLDTPRRGGGTHFKELDVEITPKAGRLVAWRNLDADGKRDDAMLHAALPLLAGKKTVLVTWVRERTANKGE